MNEATSQGLLDQYGFGNLLSGTVLVVDDEPLNVEVLRTFLESDYRVIEALSGNQALELVQVHPVDVVLTDQRMPGMTGVELLEKARNLQRDSVGIVVTGYTDPPALISAINRAQAFRFIRKPWQPEEVLEAVASACRHVQASRAIGKLVEQLHARSTELQRAVDDLQAANSRLLHMERLAMTGRLASGIAHDLRNAMSGLLLLEQELSLRGVEQDLVESARIGLTGVRNLLISLETMNQYVRHKRLSMSIESFDPALAVRDAVAVLRLDLSFRQRDLQVDAVENALPMLIGDRQKVVQVLVNLLRNATQATRKGQAVAVTVQRDGDYAVYTVDDSGPGVPDDLRGELFNAFVSTKGEEGVGMGLYMAQLIVANHSGRVEVGRSPLGGAQFRVFLPLTVDQ
jgi:signal transduction histidine kinase